MLTIGEEKLKIKDGETVHEIRHPSLEEYELFVEEMKKEPEMVCIKNLIVRTGLKEEVAKKLSIYDLKKIFNAFTDVK